MGRDKALLTVDGRPMARRVADVLDAAGAVRVRALGGDLDGLRALGLSARADRWPGEGPLGALVQALDDAGADVDAVAVLACDLLAPDADALATVVATLAGSSADVVVPRVDDRPQWMHGVWRTRVARLLGDVFATGERSIHGAVGGLEIRFADGVDADALRDADVPDDLPPAAAGDHRP